MNVILLTQQEANTVRGGSMQPVANYEPSGTYRLNTGVVDIVEQKLGYAPNVVPLDSITMNNPELL
jgi:hypothetical protein